MWTGNHWIYSFLDVLYTAAINHNLALHASHLMFKGYCPPIHTEWSCQAHTLPERSHLINIYGDEELTALLRFHELKLLWVYWHFAFQSVEQQRHGEHAYVYARAHMSAHVSECVCNGEHAYMHARAHVSQCVCNGMLPEFPRTLYSGLWIRYMTTENE